LATNRQKTKRQTNRQTDGQHQRLKPLSLSRKETLLLWNCVFLSQLSMKLFSYARWRHCSETTLFFHAGWCNGQ